MKRFGALLTVLLSLVFTIESRATHLMGGEITAHQVHDSTYRITLTVYRDTLGIPMDSVANFILRDTSGATVMTFSIPYDSIISGSTLRLYPYGVEVYLFTDTITLPSSGTFHISFTDCCRNGAIQNLSNPLNDNMYLTTTVTHFSSSSNSTPFFLVPPVVFLPVNTSWAYNPLPFDLNGDSLVWSLDTPLTAFNTPCPGYTDPPSTSTGTFSINSVTGSISWTASTIGNYDATVLVDEYRNGVKIGEIRRDMQFIVVPVTNNMSYISNMSEVPTDTNGNYHVDLNAKSEYRFSFFAEDVDVSDSVTMGAYGEPFMFTNPHRANFFVAKTGKNYGNEVEGTLIWKPTIPLIRTKPYIIVYRVTDGLYTRDYSVLYTVNGEKPQSNNGWTGIEEMDEGQFEVFPNPVSNLLNLKMNNAESANLTLELYNIYGGKVMQRNLPTQSGNQIVSTPVNLENGQYILLIKDADKLVHHDKILISQ